MCYDQGTMSKKADDFTYLNASPSEGRILIEEGYNLREDLGNIDELMNSIIQNGVQQPIHVQAGGEPGVFILRAGHRRITALRKAMALFSTQKAQLPDTLNKGFIPARIVKGVENRSDSIIQQFTRNGGKPFTPLEQAKGVAKLIDLGWTDTKIAGKLGYSPMYICDLKLLAGAPSEAQELVRTSKMTATMLVDLQKEGHSGANLVKLLECAKKKADAADSRIMPKHLDARQAYTRNKHRRNNEPIILSAGDDSLPRIPANFQSDMVLPKARALLEVIHDDPKTSNAVVKQRENTLRLLIPYLEGSVSLEVIVSRILDPKFEAPIAAEPPKRKAKRKR